MSMRILILGAGGTGGYFGGRLAEAGGDVTFLVRPKRREQLARDGLRIESSAGNLNMPVKALTQEEISAHFDVVIISAKAYGLAGAIEAVRPAVGPKTLILPILNGMKHLDDLDAVFGRARVLGGTCHVSVVLDEDGKIRHLTQYASLTQGARSSEQEAGAAAVHKELSRGAFEAKCSTDIVGTMWEKWVFLATLAGSTCLMRATIGEIVRTDSGKQFISNMLDECAAIASANGNALKDESLSTVRSALTDPASNISASMLRDMERGGRIEADHIIGDMISRGRARSLPAPLLEIAYIRLQAYQNAQKAVV
jgi:2-dehydropantoate 2-reductase